MRIEVAGWSPPPWRRRRARGPLGEGGAARENEQAPRRRRAGSQAQQAKSVLMSRSTARTGGAAPRSVGPHLRALMRRAPRRSRRTRPDGQDAALPSRCSPASGPESTASPGAPFRATRACQTLFEWAKRHRPRTDDGSRRRQGEVPDLLAAGWTVLRPLRRRRRRRPGRERARRPRPRALADLHFVHLPNVETRMGTPTAGARRSRGRPRPRGTMQSGERGRAARERPAGQIPWSSSRPPRGPRAQPRPGDGCRGGSRESSTVRGCGTHRRPGEAGVPTCTSRTPLRPRALLGASRCPRSRRAP
jgi:hypothetical protein